jgi:hypothetical protein
VQYQCVAKLRTQNTNHTDGSNIILTRQCHGLPHFY